VLLSASAASAYRPFDGTDAAVADRGIVEIEFGPAGFLKIGADRFLVAPALIANAGFTDRWELVLEGKQQVLLGTVPPDTSRSRIVDTALNVKTVVREGVLQDQPGPSFAIELGMLLPTVNDESGVGAQGTAIVSHRFGPVTAHLNGGLALSRAKRLDVFGNLIVEGPWTWPVRPVSEVSAEVDGGSEATVAALGGFIWPVSERLAFDGGVRVGRAAGESLFEVRLGLTFSFNLSSEAQRANVRRAGF
jgi:hypothetical protein